MTWSDRYLGLPYVPHGRDGAGCDCWGLVRLVFAQELGIALPSYLGDYVDASERKEIDGLLRDGAASSAWHEVPSPDAFDVPVFRLGRWRSHVGIAIDSRRMLHVQPGTTSAIADLTDPRWKSRRVMIARHEEVACPTPD